MELNVYHLRIYGPQRRSRVSSITSSTVAPGRKKVRTSTAKAIDLDAMGTSEHDQHMMIDIELSKTL
jgi:hypothetical protein